MWLFSDRLNLEGIIFSTNHYHQYAPQAGTNYNLISKKSVNKPGLIMPELNPRKKIKSVIEKGAQQWSRTSPHSVADPTPDTIQIIDLNRIYFIWARKQRMSRRPRSRNSHRPRFGPAAV